MARKIENYHARKHQKRKNDYMERSLFPERNIEPVSLFATEWETSWYTDDDGNSIATYSPAKNKPVIKNDGEETW